MGNGEWGMGNGEGNGEGIVLTYVVHRLRLRFAGWTVFEVLECLSTFFVDKPHYLCNKSTMAKTKKKPVGRPTKYKPKYCAKLIEYMRQPGELVVKPIVLSGGKEAGSKIQNQPLGHLPRFFEGFAINIGVSTSTLALWRKEFPEFSEAYNIAKNIQLEKMQIGGLSGIYQSNFTIFAMKNMHDWTDKSETEHRGEITLRGDPVLLDDLKDCSDD